MYSAIRVVEVEFRSLGPWPSLLNGRSRLLARDQADQPHLLQPEVGYVHRLLVAYDLEIRQQGPQFIAVKQHARADLAALGGVLVERLDHQEPARLERRADAPFQPTRVHVDDRD